MRLPHRSIRSIQPLPSIYTVFPANHDNTDSSNSAGINSGTRLLRHIEDGIEVVPFERINTSAPILSPYQEEKEVFVVTHKELSAVEKPLPSPPRSIWERMSTKQRILALLGAQFVILLTIGTALLAAKSHASANDLPAGARTFGDDSSSANINAIRRGPFAVPIQLPQQQSSACLARLNESVAWQCASDATFQLNILPSAANDANKTMITLGPPPGNDSFHHGHQIPEIRPVELTAIIDGDSSGDGAAYQFRTTYNRVVLLREDDLTPAEKPRGQPLTAHPTFQTGESLWRCVFNETLIEGYIYVNQPTTPETASNGASTSNTSNTVHLPKVPYVVKLVDQRVPNGQHPYCEKVRVQQGRTLSRGSGKVMLDLSDAASELEASKSEPLKSAKIRIRQDTQTASHCRCQWLIQ